MLHTINVTLDKTYVHLFRAIHPFYRDFALGRKAKWLAGDFSFYQECLNLPMWNSWKLVVTYKNRSQPLFSWILKSRIIFHPHVMSWLLSLIYLNIHLFNFSANIYCPVAMCRVCVSTRSLSCVQLFATRWTLAFQAPLPTEFSRQEYWSGLLFPSPGESSRPRDRTHISYVTWTGRQVLYHYCRYVPYVVNNTEPCLWGFIAKFRLKLKKVGKATRPSRYDYTVEIPYDFTVEVTNRFKGLDLIECLKNYGQRLMTLYRRQWSRPSPRKRKAKWLSEEALQIAEKRRVARGKGEKKR